MLNLLTLERVLTLTYGTRFMCKLLRCILVKSLNEAQTVHIIITECACINLVVLKGKNTPTNATRLEEGDVGRWRRATQT